MTHPTPYPSISILLSDLATQLRDILADQFVGIYLYGSLALGDFDPDHSDIDFIVVTEGTLTDRQVAAIRGMHTRIAASESVWAGRIEAAYIPRAALNHRTPTADAYPQYEKSPAGLVLIPLEIGWAFQRYTLREHGIAILGPDPRTLLDPVDPADLRQAVIAIAGGWLDQAEHDAGWHDWLRDDPHAMQFVVLTLCRLLYTLETAQVASKPAAGRRVQQTDPRWHDLIERALAHRSNVRDTDEMITLLRHVVDRSEAE